ncbi:hypothetical protein [Ectothiorhodospira lacustris]|uniref:hypothetical protein n=1 Tax=Ectothiorhodospira lacustris TaxID=2899127 RepID=UPI001EE9242D|nr:hypothetical protein [Ectothiorhodospira lacustris]MCG5500532.1 hypothetical protein [Ectothiorhodospira lacustris]MCG5509395.1 hypothetical protein [Ectothiorhodospira lacustris]MCG5521449.1 hypothetical protein [Ectothiorhodospira lacustris]
MTAQHHAQARELALRAFAQDRDDILWQRCLLMADQDADAARSAYLEEATAVFAAELEAQAQSRRPDPTWKHPLIGAILPGLIALVISILFTLAQYPFPFVAWSVLMGIFFVPSAGILGYVGVFALRYHLEPGFRIVHRNRAERMAVMGFIALALVGAIGTYKLIYWPY